MNTISHSIRRRWNCGNFSILLLIGVTTLVCGAVTVNEVQNHTIGNALKDIVDFIVDSTLTIAEMSMKHLLRGEVTVNASTAITDEEGLTALAEQINKQEELYE